MTVPQPLPSLDEQIAEQEINCNHALNAGELTTSAKMECAILASLKRLRERDADAHAERTKIIEALEKIKMRAYSEEPCEELEDAQRDLRIVHELATAAIRKLEPTK